MDQIKKSKNEIENIEILRLVDNDVKVKMIKLKTNPMQLIEKKTLVKCQIFEILMKTNILITGVAGFMGSLTPKT